MPLTRWKIQDRRQVKNRHTTKTKHNPDKANNAKYSKTKLAWFSCFLRHSARKRGGLTPQCSQAHTGRYSIHCYIQQPKTDREIDDSVVRGPSIATGERSSWNSGLCGPRLSVTVLQGLAVELLKLLWGGVRHSSIAVTSSWVTLPSWITVNRPFTSATHVTPSTNSAISALFHVTSKTCFQWTGHVTLFSLAFMF